MVDAVSSINNNINANRLQAGKNNRSREYVGFSGTLERTPDADCYGNKKNTGAKLLLILSGIGLAAAGIVAAVKFSKQGYLKKAQKTFQKVYMRDDISKEETAAILKRFKELEKIKNDNEYIKAVFAEAKKNYGFENLPIKLADKNSRLTGKSLGGCDNLNNEIYLSTTLKREACINTIHHELRHAKQNYLAFHYNPEKYVEALNNNTSEMISDKVYKGLDIKKGVEWLSEYMGKPNKANVAAKYENFAEQCLKSKAHYVDPQKNYKEYRNSFHEKDAYAVGEQIEKSLKNIPDKIC